MPGIDASKASVVPPIFGRAEVLTEIDRTIERVRTGSGEGLLLAGGDGSGRSLFLRTVIQRARHHGFRVLEGRALPVEIPQPFSLLRDLLRSDGRTPSAAADDREREPMLPVFLAPLSGTDAGGEAPLADRGEPIPDSEGIATMLSPLDAPGEWIGTVRNDLYATVIQYLAELAGSEPVLLAVDDLHFADSASIEFFGRLAPELAQHRIALVATVGSGTRIPGPTREPVESLARSTSVRTVPLRPLAIAEVAEFAQWIRRGIPADPADVRRWHAQTEGNPLFVEQLVRTTTGVGSPLATASPGGTADLNEILFARVRALGETERRTLTYASLLGREFALPSLIAIAEMDEERVTESLDRLVADGLLREKGDEIVEFVTEGVRARVYGDLTETRRRILHRRVGRALEQHGRASEYELARQFYLGRDDAKAAEYNFRAALSAMRGFAFETAVPHLERALEAERRRPDRNPAREVRILVELGRSFDELGEFHRSDVVLSEGVALARPRPDLDAELGRALLGLAQTRQDQGEYASSEALAREAYGRLERVGSAREVMTTHRVLGIVYWRLGQLADAEHHLRLALDIAEREGTAIERGHALVDVANTMLLRDEAKFADALRLYEEAAELFGSGQDLGARARVLMNRAVLLYSSGRHEEGLRGLDAAIEAAERSRSPIWMGYCYLNLALMNAELGNADRAGPALERAETFLTPLGDRLAPEQISLARGLLAEAQGLYDSAESHLADALRQARELKAEPEVSEILFRLAHVAFSRGDLPAARGKLAEAREAGLDVNRSDLAVRVATLDAALGGNSDPHR
jgi:tetratricopeptide (TPR) repeat protein